MFVCEGVWVLEKQRSRFERLSWQRLVFPDLHQPNLLWNTVKLGFSKQSFLNS